MEKQPGNRTKKTVANFLSSILFQITATFAGFITPMLILNIYGAAMFGFSTSVMAVVGGINLLEIGLGSGLMQALFRPLHDGNVPQINGLLARAKRYYNHSGMLILLGAALVAVVYSLNHGSSSFFELFFLALTLLFGSALEYIFIGRFRVLLTADEKVGVLLNIQTGALVLSSAIRIVLMSLGVGIVIMQLIATAVYLLRAIFVAFYVHRKYPQVSFQGERSTVQIENTSVFWHNISNLVVLNAPFLLLLLLTEKVTTSIFAIYAIVYSAISSILYAVFSHAVVAGFGKVVAKGDRNALRKQFDLYEFVFTICLFVAFVTTTSMIRDFVKIYSAGISNVNFFLPYITLLFTIWGLLFSLRYPLIALLQADGHFKQTKNSVVIEMLLMIVFSFIGVLLYGLNGVFIGMIISAAYRAVHLIWYVNKKILQRKLTTSIRRLAVNTLLALPIMWYFDGHKLFKIDGWVQLLLYGVVQAFLFLAVFTLANLLCEWRMVKQLRQFAEHLIKK